MTGSAGTLELVVRELSLALSVLPERIAGLGVEGLLAELGLRSPPGLVTGDVAEAITAASHLATELPGLVTTLVAAIDADDVVTIISTGKQLVIKVGEVISAVERFGAAIGTAAPALAGLSPEQRRQLTAFAGLLPMRLVDYLLIEYLSGRAPGAVAWLELLGIIGRVSEPGNPDEPLSPPYVRRELHLEYLLDLVADPGRYARTAYDWGNPAFNGVALLGAFQRLLQEWLVLPAVLLTSAGQPAVLEVYLFGIRVDDSTSPPGLVVSLRFPGTQDFIRTYPLRPPWTLTTTASGRFVADMQGTITPSAEIELRPPSGAAQMTITFALRGEPPTPFLLLGTAGGSRLEFDRLSLEAGLALRFDPATGETRGGPTAQGEITGGKLVIDASSGDGFLSTVLGGGRIESGFDVGFSFTPDVGLQFHGSGALEISVPVHVALGPVEVQQVYLVARPAGGKVPIELSAGFSTQLGPIKAAVDRLGVLVDLGFPPGGGNLGPLDLAFAFKPPNGVGLSVDLAVLTGGGYLYLDPDRGEYFGELELELGGFLTVKALALITTRMPDGSSGFSLLLVLIGEFGGGGLQLGYGFRLLAVGGLVGVNRSMRLDALVEGVRSGAIESVMFPQDIVENAPRILSDLRAFFPPAQGKFLVGPMAKIGWGTPTLISLSVGVIIEIPGNIAIVGVLKVVLPTEEAALLVLQANFVGAIEPDKQRLWFFASLFESRVLLMTLDGEMGVMVVWGNDPNLVLTVGGFHPAFTPPPLAFPNPRRVSIDILNDSAGRIRMSGYFAVTSNTAQFGAQAELYFGFSKLSIEGHIGFDALFRFSPFAFVIGVSASVALKVFGVGVFSISLAFALEGPTPWRAHGRGSITLLFFEVSADFDITWGEERDTTLPPVDVLPLLAAEFAKLENWQTLSPGGGNPLVSLRKLADNEDDLVLHPLGTLVVRQRAIPLDLRLDKIGSQRPKDANRFTVTVPGGGLVKRADTDEMFALAQFQDMDDAAKLSRRAYELQHGGLELSVDGGLLASSRAVRRSARYEQSVIDKQRTPERFVPYPASLFTHLLAGNSVTRSPLARRQAELRQPFSDTIEMTGEQFVVADTRTNVAVAAPFDSESAALDHLADQVAEDPRLAGSLHVIPGVEQTVVGVPR